MSGPLSDTGADAHLVLRAQDGEASAFEQLVERHHGRLFRTAFMVVGNRPDAEDTVQNTLILAWRRLHLLREPASFRGWLMRICTNEANNVIRRRARNRTEAHDHDSLERLSSQPADRAGHSLAADPALTNEVSAQVQALAQMVSTLSPELRACWALREIDNMPYKQIAQTLSITEATARGRLARARAILVRRMEEWR